MNNDELAAIDATTRAMIAATDRRLAALTEIKSPRELGIIADPKRLARIRTRSSRRHRAINR